MAMRCECRTARGPAQVGSVLLIAVLVLSAVLVFGLALLETSASSADQSSRALARMRASALAEGAIELLYEELRGSPGFRGTKPVVDDALGRREVSVTTVASNEVEIVARGTVDGVGVAWRSRASGSVLTAIVDTIFVAGSLTLRQGSHATWDGTTKYGGSVRLFDGSTTSGAGAATTAAIGVTLAGADFAAIADQSLPPSTVLGPGVATGNIYVAGSLTIVAPFTLTGSIYATGSVTVQGSGTETVSLVHPGGGAVLVAPGLGVQSLGQLNVTGTVLVMSSVDFDTVSNVQMTGSLLADGGVTLRRVPVANFRFDPRVRDATLPGVDGLTTFGSLTELWRRPGA